jgi:stage II sporulation protein E
MEKGPIKQRVKRLLSRFLVYVFLCAVLFVFSYSKIDAEISPFAVAFLFGLSLISVNITVPILTMIAIVLLKDPTQNNIISVLFEIAVLVLFVLSYKIIHKKCPPNMAGKLYLPLLILFFIISQGFNVYAAFIGGGDLVKSIISVIVGGIFLSAVFVSVKAIRSKRFSVQWTIDQIICLMTVVVVFALGLSGFEYRYFDIHKFITILVIFVGVYYAEPKSAIMVVACFGLGRSFVALNLVYVAIYTLLGISCYTFKTRNRAYSIIALLFTDLVIGFYFGGYIEYNLHSLTPIAAAVLVFSAVPRTAAQYFTFGAGGIGGFLVSKNTINRNTALISARMRSLSAVFNEMQNTYRNLTRGNLPPQSVAEMLAVDINSTVCANCPNKIICKKKGTVAKDIDDAIINSIKTALKRGQVSLLDISNVLSIKCTRINTLLGAINKAVAQNRNKEQIIAGLDSGKILMANLLSGVSQLCSKFADDVCQTVIFDNERAEFVKEELLYKNIICEDCLITKTGKAEFMVSVLVPRADAGSKIIERVVSSVCGHKMITDEVVDADTSGFAIVSVRSAPRYSLLFGVATVSKDFNKANGDTFSFLRVSNSKTIMAICDGMGAGERAMRASTLALTLVENFYKAGFPDEIIMYSVNKLLTFTGQDIFSALDICVLDLGNGDIDFIKVGAPDGFIKREREVEVVESGALPLGILDEIEPKITRAVLLGGDMVVLCSDGVLDAFGGSRSVLAGFINNTDTKNPQELADKLLTETVERSKKSVADDCTVTVARIVAIA